MKSKLPEPISKNFGCKVGWLKFATRAEAEAWLPEVEASASRKMAAGHDFGWSRPGEIRENDAGEFILTYV